MQNYRGNKRAFIWRRRPRTTRDLTSTLKVKMQIGLPTSYVFAWDCTKIYKVHSFSKKTPANLWAPMGIFSKNLGHKWTLQMWKRLFETESITYLSLVEPVGLGSTPTGSESFSKFVGWQLCSPLTYKPYNSSKKGSKSVIKCVKISRGW